jgi:hypothetical protein
LLATADALLPPAGPNQQRGRTRHEPEQHVIPVFNEEANIALVAEVEQAFKGASTKSSRDDGSDDGSWHCCTLAD